MARHPLRASGGLEAAGSSSHSAQRWNPAISRPAPELAGCVWNNFSRRGKTWCHFTALRVSVPFFFPPNSGSFVNKKRHSNPLFFFLPLFFFFICLVLADDAPSLAVYVPWLSLFTSLPPSVASWYHVAAVGTVFFSSSSFRFFFLSSCCWRRADSSLENFHRSPFLPPSSSPPRAAALPGCRWLHFVRLHGRRSPG